jgi:hypothetical protein
MPTLQCFRANFPVIKIRIMTKLLDEALSRELATRIKSKPKDYFKNAYQGLLTISQKGNDAKDGATYVQGFLVMPGAPYKPLEYGWVELEKQIIDPTFPHLGCLAENMYYFPAQLLTGQQLQAILEESQEDYPEDDPLPVYGDQPYEYYGNSMLGGSDYKAAYELAVAKCRELNQPKKEAN